MEKIVDNIRTYNIHALLVIGGFEVRAAVGPWAGWGHLTVSSGPGAAEVAPAGDPVSGMSTGLRGRGAQGRPHSVCGCW